MNTVDARRLHRSPQEEPERAPFDRSDVTFIALSHDIDLVAQSGRRLHVFALNVSIFFPGYHNQASVY